MGSETFCNDAYKFRELAKAEPRLVGDFVWAGMDYLGEVMVGSWEYEDYAKNFDGGLGWVSAGSGRIDLTGKPLGEALYTAWRSKRTTDRTLPSVRSTIRVTGTAPAHGR